jgi:hypothetical protein
MFACLSCETVDLVEAVAHLCYKRVEVGVVRLYLSYETVEVGVAGVLPEL